MIRVMLTIVSGGQSGVDRAALDVALELGLRCGGWCPAERVAEDGRIDQRYPLRSTPSADPAQRTEWNVRDSDATLIISAVPLTGGTALTRRCAVRLHRPLRVVDLHQPFDAGEIRAWLHDQRVRTLNVAGPRESKEPGAYSRAREILTAILEPPDASSEPT